MAPKYPHIHEIKHIELKTESKKDLYQIITFWRLSPKIKGETLILPMSLAAVWEPTGLFMLSSENITSPPMGYMLS